MENDHQAATGRRKSSVARVRLASGDGSFTINGHDISEYLKREPLVAHAKEPLIVTEMADKVTVECTTRGGGLTGQSGAVRLAVARALAALNDDLRKPLRQGGFLTRDARRVERKKYGRPKARKRFQYSKR